MKSPLAQLSITVKGGLIAAVAAIGLLLSGAIGLSALQGTKDRLTYTVKDALPSTVQFEHMRLRLIDAHLQFMRATTYAALNAVNERQATALTDAQDAGRAMIAALAQTAGVDLSAEPEAAASAGDTDGTPSGEAAAIAAIAAQYEDYVGKATQSMQLMLVDPGFGSLAVTAADNAFVALLAEASQFADTLIAKTRDRIEAGLAATKASRTLYQIVLALSTVVTLALASLVISSIVRPVNRLNATMSALSEDDLSVRVPGTWRQDEIGAMARAVEVFKASLIARHERAAKEREQVEIDAVRAEEDRQLQSSIAAVAAQAADGAFSARVDARFDRDDLNAVAADLNRVMDSVEAGIDETNRVMKAVAEGHLGTRIEGRFMGAFASLQTNTNATIERLATLIHQIEETAAVVRTGAEKIVRSANDLSDGTSSQAASLEEASAAMEEMSQSVSSNAQHTNTALSLAHRASDRATSGASTVSNVVEAMARIEESATKINEIVGIIDSIAFQTNLLALNAAVEAARAGEAGKGFAVVASEVRTLAQRSAEASRDIGQLIGTSTKQVAEGSGLVQGAGTSLAGISEAIGEVDGVVQVISKTSGEQATGVREISQTVTSLDAMTQKHSIIAQQSAAEATALAASARELSGLMDFFTSKPGRPASAA